MKINTRTAERLDGTGKWRSINPIDIKKGTIFRLSEQDGTDVISSTGIKMFIACTNAFVNKDGVVEIEVVNEERAQKSEDSIMTNNWISVTERLPEKPEYDWVLVQTKMISEGYYCVPHIAELVNGLWQSDCYEGLPLEETAGVKVTHWMPLPPAPDEMV